MNRSKKKILVVSNLYPPFQIGGYEIAEKDTVELMRKCGFEVEVITSDYGEGHGGLETNLVRKMRLTADWYGKNEKIDPIKNARHNLVVVRKKIAMFKPDAIYAWNMTYLGKQLVRYLVSEDEPVVFHLMDTGLAKLFRTKRNAGAMERKLWESVFVRDVFPWQLKNVIYISNHIREQHETVGLLPEKGKVIYPGIDSKNVAKKKHYKLLGNKLRCVFVGQVAEHKGVLLLKKGLERFAEANPKIQVRLSIYGWGNEGYVRKVKNVKKIKIRFKKFVDRKIIYKELKDFDVGFFPSVWEEPFGIAQLEMMAAGLPIISTGRGGSREMLDKKNSLLLDPITPENFSKQISSLVKDYDRVAVKIGRAARKGVAMRFSENQYRESLMDFWGSVLESSVQKV